MRFFRITYLFFLSVVLVACASGGSAIVQTLQNVWDRAPDLSQGRLNPNFRYLRLVVNGNVVLLALGYTDADPQGPIEVWYSAEKEVLKLQNGRLVGAYGTTIEWRSVSLPNLPNWSEVSNSAEPIRWVRTRDVMPGYRFGIKDELVTRKVAAPSRSQLQGLDPNLLKWFEESNESTRGAGGLPQVRDQDLLPPARYAVALGHSADSVVYAEQCLTPNLCFSWQRWPVSDPRDIKK